MVLTKKTYIYLPKVRFNGYKQLAKVIPSSYASKLEQGIYDVSINYKEKNDIDNNYFNLIYNSNISAMCFNLDQWNCPSLIIKVMNGSISVHDLPLMDRVSLNPELWKSYLEFKEFVEYKRNNMDSIDDFKCRKCGHNKAENIVMQTRSADEPATVFVICLKCRKQFRM